MSKAVTSVGVIGAAVNRGQPKDGTQLGPNALREGGIDQILKTGGFKVTYYDEIFQPTEEELQATLGCLNQKAFVNTSLQLAEAMQKSVSENDFTLVLGGDHSLATGSIMGHFEAFPDSLVVWVDAHTDIHTPESSSSGNTHGMPVAFNLKEIRPLIAQCEGFEKLKAPMEANQLIYIGLRDVEPPELAFLKEFNISYFNMHDVKELGIKKVMQIVFRLIATRRPNCKIHLSFDIDALDPEYAASTGTPVPGGLSLDEGKYICQQLARTGQLRSMDIVEVNPCLGSTEEVKKTVASAVELAKCILCRGP